jgi:hypothetical protein
MQGLVFALPQNCPAKSLSDSELTGVLFASGEHCLDPGSDKAPARRDHGHSYCCIFCLVGSRDLSALAIDPSPGVESYLPLQPIGFVARRYVEDFDGHPMGWTSSWSSRAPPFFT